MGRVSCVLDLVNLAQSSLRSGSVSLFLAGSTLQQSR